MKPQPDHLHVFTTSGKSEYHAMIYCGENKDDIEVKAPYAVGDILWVRETFVVESNFNLDSESAYPPPFSDGRPISRHDNPLYGAYWEQCHYRATDKAPELCYDDCDEPCCRWKPSIHMPRWAARLFLEVTNVRAQRVQEITEADIAREGFRFVFNDPMCYPAEYYFKQTWNSIYGQWKKRIDKETGAIWYECYPWSERDIPDYPKGVCPADCVAYPNPWVFANTFKQIEAPK